MAGMIIAFLVAQLKIPSFVATLAGWLSYLGAILVVTESTGTIIIPDATPEIIPLLAVLPLQLLSYHMSVLRGYDPDFPRNLSKTLTVD